MAVYTESFNKANSGTLGPDQTWTEDAAAQFAVLNSELNAPTDGDNWARADVDAASVNTYAQLSIVAALGSEAFFGPIVRKDSTGTATYYTFNRIGKATLALTTWRLVKVVAGAFTTLSGPTVLTMAIPELVKVSANGSTIKGYLDGVEITSVTDTAITTGTRGGVFAAAGTTSRTRHGDSWEFGDLPSPAAPHRQPLVLQAVNRSAVY